MAKYKGFFFFSIFLCKSKYSAQGTKLAPSTSQMLVKY